MTVPFKTKRERKRWLGLVIRQEKTVEDISRAYDCSTETVWSWLKSEGIDVVRKTPEALLEDWPKEDLIFEIYRLRSKLSAKETRLIEVTKKAAEYKALYENKIESGGKHGYHLSL